MEEFIYKNDYESNELLIDRIEENVEYAIRRLASHLEHNYKMNYVDQLAIEAIEKVTKRLKAINNAKPNELLEGVDI